MKKPLSRALLLCLLAALQAGCSGGRTSGALPGLGQTSSDGGSVVEPDSARCRKGSCSVSVATAAPTAPPSVAPTSNPSASASSSAPGILIPLYKYPSNASAWSAVIAAKQANPGTSVVAVVNPDNGPGAAIDSNYVKAVAQLKAAGVTVFGYVHTSYGAASTASLESQMQQWMQWYAPSGMFFDEMAYVPGFESYYSTLNKYAKSLGMTATIGNPGTDSVASYIGTVDTIVIYENKGYPTLAFLSGGWHAAYPKSNFAFIAYGVSSLNTALEQSEAAYVRYEYITNQLEPDPYDAFSPYLSTEVSVI